MFISSDRTAAWEAAAELMAALEAGSRFQAGVRAGELGLAHRRGHPVTAADSSDIAHTG